MEPPTTTPSSVTITSSPAAPRGTAYECGACGRSSSSGGTCCGQPMTASRPGA